MPVPTPGQKDIPLADWKRFLRVADWFERTVEQGKGVLRPTYGQALIVKTPAGGIAARDGATIFSATCIKCVAAETSTAGERTIHETDEELVVYNFHTSAVDGDIFVKTALSLNGTRYVEVGGGSASYKVTTFPRWDEVAKELFVRAIPTPSDETSESDKLETADVIDGEVSGDVVIYLTGIFMDEGRTTADVNSIRPGLRIWAIAANNRLELVSFPTQEVDRYAFSHGESGNIIPFALMSRVNALTNKLGASPNGPTAIGVVRYDTTANPLGNLSEVNGAWSVGTDAGTGGNEVAIRGSASHGLSNYVFARVNQSVLGSDAGAPGQMWGPTPLDTELYPGIPGFVLMMGENSPVALGDGGFIYGFLQVPGFQTAYAKAIAQWSDATTPAVPLVICNPVLITSGPSGPAGTVYPYDGSTVGPDGETMPSIEIVVYLPRNSTERDPNIQSGNFLWYRQAGPQRKDSATQPWMPGAGSLPDYICAGDYLDDKIGTIKFWKLGTGAIPQGWQQLAGSAGDFIRCANAFADVGTAFGTTGTDHTLIDMICIERFQ